MHVSEIVNNLIFKSPYLSGANIKLSGEDKSIEKYQSLFNLINPELIKNSLLFQIIRKTARYDVKYVETNE